MSRPITHEDIYSVMRGYEARLDRIEQGIHEMGNELKVDLLTVGANDFGGTAMQGITLADDGDFVSIQNGRWAFRLTYGVAVYSANKGGVRRGTFTENGHIHLAEQSGPRDMIHMYGNSSASWNTITTYNVHEVGIWGATRGNWGDLRALNYIPASDGNLKTDIENIEGALETIRALRGRRFAWREPSSHGSIAGDKTLGLIAQEVALVCPEATHFSVHDDDPDTFGEWGLNTTALIAMLVEAVRELAARVDELIAS